MNIVRHALALAACVTILAGCGGGGSKSNAIPAGSSSSTAASTLPKGSATLNLKFPANFHHARFPVTTKTVTFKGKKRLVTVASTRRSPKYINPTAGNIIHVYAYSNDGVVSGEVTPSGGVALTGSGLPDGSQTINLSLPAETYNQVTVVETDTNGNELARGNTASNYSTTINPSGGITLSLVMEMNAQYIALTTDLNAGADAVILDQENDDVGTPFCAYNTTAKFYAFAADSTGGFVLPSTPSGSGYDPNTSVATIPGVTLAATTPNIQTTVAGFLTSFSGAPESQYAGFQVLDPDPQYFNSAYFGYGFIANVGTAPCQIIGSFSEEPANVGDTVTMTVSGGNAPYTATETDGGNCTLTETTLTTWNLVPQISGSQCQVTLTDSNSGNTSYAYLDVNSIGPGPLSLMPSLSCFAYTGEDLQITINGGYPPYSVGSSTDSTVFTTANGTSDPFDVITGSNYTGNASVTITDSAFNTITFNANNGC